MSKSFMEREFRSIICGDLIGRGAARSTYLFRGDESVVIKIETRGGSFQNVSEWELWGWVDKTPMARWFAPCVDISSSGAILTQRRVTPLREGERPAKLPAYLCDLKTENFGMYQGRVVCCDYGTVFSAIRSASARMVRAKWRS